MTMIMQVIQKIATPKWLVILFVLYAIVFGLIVMMLSQLTALTGGIGILDFDRGYSVERVAEVFNSYGNDGMALYRRIQFLDIFNPAIYSLCFAAIIYLLWRNRNVAWLALLPLVAGLLDYAENLTLFLLARSYPQLSGGLVSLSSLLSIVKNIALIPTLIAFIVGLFLFGLDWLKGKK